MYDYGGDKVIVYELSRIEERSMVHPFGLYKQGNQRKMLRGEQLFRYIEGNPRRYTLSIYEAIDIILKMRLLVRGHPPGQKRPC
jgi:hypothetical protein